MEYGEHITQLHVLVMTVLLVFALIAHQVDDPPDSLD
jgi:hypothetical protein